MLWKLIKDLSMRSKPAEIQVRPEPPGWVIGDTKLKLHIGGKQPKQGWKILNALDGEGVDFVGNVCDLSEFPDACCEVIYASHVMEHVKQRDFLATLKGIHRI